MNNIRLQDLAGINHRINEDIDDSSMSSGDLNQLRSVLVNWGLSEFLKGVSVVINEYDELSRLDYTDRERAEVTAIAINVEKMAVRAAQRGL